jgi:hypothetical protein
MRFNGKPTLYQHHPRDVLGLNEYMYKIVKGAPLWCRIPQLEWTVGCF